MGQPQGKGENMEDFEVSEVINEMTGTVVAWTFRYESRYVATFWCGNGWDITKEKHKVLMVNICWNLVEDRVAMEAIA